MYGANIEHCNQNISFNTRLNDNVQWIFEINSIVKTKTVITNFRERY